MLLINWGGSRRIIY